MEYIQPGYSIDELVSMCGKQQAVKKETPAISIDDIMSGTYNQNSGYNNGYGAQQRNRNNGYGAQQSSGYVNNGYGAQNNSFGTPNSSYGGSGNGYGNNGYGSDSYGAPNGNTYDYGSAPNNGYQQREVYQEPQIDGGAYSTPHQNNTYGASNNGYGAPNNNQRPSAPPQNNSYNNQAPTGVYQASPQNRATQQYRSNAPALNPMMKYKLSDLIGGARRFDLHSVFGAVNGNYDIDISTFMTDDRDRALGDDWFVFYGSPTSPDGSVTYHKDNNSASVSIDLDRVSPNVMQIVLVLSIDEALEKGLDFKGVTQNLIELKVNGNAVQHYDFMQDNPPTDLTSMVLCKVYRKGNTDWKFSIVRAGFKTDLAGLCGKYGIEVS